jgi:branched-chain amino acid transport system ATP-binding protein
VPPDKVKTTLAPDSEAPGVRLPAATERSGELRVASVYVHFDGLTALDDVSLDVEPGRIVGVIGPNGAGKTTLFNVICGFVRPASGTVSWRDRDLGGVRPHELVRLGIARTAQGVRLFPHLTALENVMVGADHLARAGFASALLGLPRADRSERALRDNALEALESLAVADIAERRAETLPYPVQKRVALARALVAHPALLLLDEPAGGLSGDDVTELTELIRGLSQSMSIVLVEHRMDLVMAVCDDVAVLDSGRLIAQGPPQTVQADARVLEAYLGAENDRDA